MALVVVRLESDDAFSDEYFRELRERAKAKDAMRNPFRTAYKRLSGGFHALNIEPLWPPVYWWGLLPLLGGALWGRAWVMSIGVCLLGIGFFWSSPFYHLLLRVGLRKKGFRGRIRHVGARTALRVVISGGE